MKVPVMRDAFQAEGLRHLCEWANKQGAVGKAVEIGSYSGEGTEVIAKHFKEVLAVDPWINGYDLNDVASHQCPMKFVFEAFQNRTKGLGNVFFKRGKSLDALEFVRDESVDLVYVDGDHRYEAVVADIQGWKPKLRKGGVLAGHDWSFPAVQKALSETLGKVDYKLFQGDSWAVAL
ncbi:MAG: class I SAM-dependent methyltransferase [Caulobacteraceae bacterium]|nr:class I SAM-dependent methyltransferase [Caulobacteraceae bacterium]